MRELGFKEIGNYLGLEMKEKHSIIDQWPFRIKRQPHHVGAEEEFATLLASDVSGTERYVEWKRTI